MKLNRMLLFVILLSLIACRPLARPTPEGQTAAQGATPTPKAATVIFPPLVLQTEPVQGAEVGLETPITLRFDQPMNRASVEVAFSIQPIIRGDLAWTDDQTVQFTPRELYKPGLRYEVTVADTAKNNDGVRLNRTFRLAFNTLSALAVTNVQPRAKTTEIALDSTITVFFNRPVVPITAIEDLGRLPNPLTFVPPVRGEGTWLNTGIYQFTPRDGFEPATEYTARVAAGLTDVNGSKLEDDFTWTFSTVTPKIVATYPKGGAIYVQTTPVISVAFNQPMDRASVEAAFWLEDTQDGSLIVEGTFTWVDEGLVEPRDPNNFYYGGNDEEGTPVPVVGVETMSFEPTEPLAMGRSYRLIIDSTAKGREGNFANLSRVYATSFKTIPDLRIVSTSPSDREAQASHYRNFEINFSAPINPDSVEIGENLLISPTMEVTRVGTYFWDNNRVLALNLETQPSSAYTVTILGSIESRYGQPLNEDRTISWQTKAFNPYLFLHAPGFDGVSTYSAYTPTLAFVTVQNIRAVNFELYHLPESDFVALNGNNSWQLRRSYQPDSGDRIRRWTVETAPLLNQAAIYGTHLSEDESVLDPGLYYLIVFTNADQVYPEAQGEARNSPRSFRQMIVVSNHNLTFKTTGTESLAWLTELNTGQPVTNVPIRFRSERGGLVIGVADEGGVATGTHEYLDSWQPRFAISDQPFAIALNHWRDGIERYQFGISTDDFLQPFNAHLYTDRAIYRPDQIVYFKGILRQDDDAHYMLPPSDTPVQVQIRDAQGKEIFASEYELNENGTFNGELVLADEAALGFYSMEAQYDDAFFSHSFQVAEFRKPEFLVEVNTAQPEYANGDTVSLTAQANFFFGGALANAQVSYSLLSADHFFRYQGSGGRYDFTDYDFRRSRENFVSGFGELIDEGTGQTDREGRFTLEVPADISNRTASQRFTLEVTITDPDSNQVVSSRADTLIHKGDFYVGLRPQRYVSTVGNAVNVDLITVDWDSLPVPEQDLTITFAKRNWYSVQVQGEDGRYYWQSEVENIPIFSTTVTTDEDGKGIASFVPEAGGVYRVEAEGIDTGGNIIRSSTFMWVSGGSFINWRQENNDRLELVTDKQEYDVGDIATILMPHPYNGPVTALVTQERGHIYHHEVMTLETNSEQLTIPITAEMSPNMFVSVVIIKAPDETTPIANFKVGYAQLPINVREKQINIALTPNKLADENYQPGEAVTYDILAVDSAGQPVKAEISLALVDKAILSLADEQGPSLLDQFWRERGLGVDTATTLAVSADRINLAIAPEAKGGGGGGFDDAFSVVRGDFKDTALWIADFTTDETGRGSVTATLPDNLTTWVLIARGITQDTLVGDEQVEILSTKPVLVRPVTPRFLVVGDEAQLSMIVQNNAREAVTIQTFFEAEGVERLSDDAASTVTIEAGDKITVDYSVKALLANEAVFRFGAKADTFEDALEITIPIHRHSTPETVGTAGVMTEDGQRLEAVAFPQQFDPTQGQFKVTIDPSLASGMRAGLTYLEHFPYECSEQTVSRFLPNIVTYRAYQALNLDDPELAEKLPGLVSFGLQRLYNQQHIDGGWGWWSNDRSNPFLTAYIVLALVEAERAGFAVDDGVLSEGISFLKLSLRRPSDVRASWEANRQAFMLYALAEAGEGDMGRTVLLFDQREKLDVYGRAYLALAFYLLDAEDARIETLLSDINSAAILSASGAHWEEDRADYYNMNTDTRSTAIVLAALTRLDPENPLAQNAVRWLMSVRERDHWKTTQETAWAVIALTDWMVATGELEGNYDWAVALNGGDLGKGAVNFDNIDDTTTLTVAVADLLAEEINRVVIERSPHADVEAGTGRLYYTAAFEYFKPVEDVTALDRGIVVSRRYELADPDADPDAPARAISEARVGDIITVRLTIVAPDNLYYLKLEDPIPAGTEAIDHSLKTTSVLNDSPELIRTRGRGWGWWWFNHTEIRDEKAVLFATRLPRGTYEYTYQIRAALPGEFRVLPTHAEEMYFPEVFGRGDGGVFTITE